MAKAKSRTEFKIVSSPRPIEVTNQVSDLVSNENFGFVSYTACQGENGATIHNVLLSRRVNVK